MKYYEPIKCASCGCQAFRITEIQVECIHCDEVYPFWHEMLASEIIDVVEFIADRKELNDGIE